ncbi:MAG TPA: hypothetical protein VF339_17525 [Gammaproteobacteria bacterium]
MAVLEDHGVERVYHFSPLHYLAFIARSRSLLSKPRLLRLGFEIVHFRSMSRKHDVNRGFEYYVHMTLHEYPRIARSKLAAGFPHIRIEVPSVAVDRRRFDLCRYNIAMTRYLRRGGSPGFPESSTNGRYYAAQQVPTARTDADKAAMLRKYLGTDTVIEVLVEEEMPLPDETTVSCFSREDEWIAREVVEALDAPWNVVRTEPDGPYPRDAFYANEVGTFLDRAIQNPQWRGSGLEFDRV